MAIKVFDSDKKKTVEMSKTRYFNSWDATMKEIKRRNEKRQENSNKDFQHEVRCSSKEAVKYKLKGTKNYMVNGFRKEKFNLSSWLWHKQVDLERRYKKISAVFSAIRKLKLWIKLFLKGKKYGDYSWRD